MTPKILIAEDKPLQAEDLVDRLVSFGFHDIMGPFASGEAALTSVHDAPPDIALLDINLSTHMTGIELAKKLNEKARVAVIYLTKNEDDATLQLSLPTFPVAYLNKPYTNNELKLAVHNAISSLGKEYQVPASKTQVQEVNILNDRIFIRNGRGKVQVMLDDVLWIQSGGGETSSVITRERFEQKSKPYTIGLNLNKVESRLDFAPHFARCSRFHIVNLAKVERILDDVDKTKFKKILVIRGEEISVGSKYRKDVMDKLKVI
jgi:DNA-binding LytR/AlgR family response regulator